ncbi:MAG: hypothetical protein ACLFWD_10915 [Anaerolineales bacterium]
MTANIARAFGRGEPIRVSGGTEGLRPTYFTWRGRRYRVRSTERQVSSRPSDGSRRLVLVRTESGLQAMLSCEPIHGRWRMEGIVA